MTQEEGQFERCVWRFLKQVDRPERRQTLVELLWCLGAEDAPPCRESDNLLEEVLEACSKEIASLAPAGSREGAANGGPEQTLLPLYSCEPVALAGLFRKHSS